MAFGIIADPASYGDASRCARRVPSIGCEASSHEGLGMLVTRNYPCLVSHYCRRGSLNRWRPISADASLVAVMQTSPHLYRPASVHRGERDGGVGLNSAARP